MEQAIIWSMTGGILLAATAAAFVIAALERDRTGIHRGQQARNRRTGQIEAGV